MASFAPKEIDLRTINNGQRFESGQIPEENAFNDPIEASYYAQEKAKNAEIIAQQALQYQTSGGTLNPLTAYPIGSIYMSVSSTSPALLFGGVWEQIEDRFLLSAGSRQANSEGGSETITLSQENLPSDITGGFGMYSNGGKNGGFDGTSANGVFSTNPQGFGGTGNYPTGQYSTAQSNPTNYIAFDLGGSSTPINVMPPYLVVYMWARVA